MGTDLTSLRQTLAVGQTDGNTGAEGITGTGGILHLHIPGGTDAAVPAVSKFPPSFVQHCLSMKMVRSYHAGKNNAVGIAIGRNFLAYRTPAVYNVVNLPLGRHIHGQRI